MQHNKSNFGKYLFKLLKHYISAETIGLISSGLLSIAIAITPYMSKRLIDTIVRTKMLSSVKTDMFIFLSACFLQSIFLYLNIRVFSYLSNKITFGIRNKLFCKILKAPLTFFEKVTSGTIIARLMNDSDDFSLFLNDFMFSVFQNVLYVALIVIGMLFISVPITLMLGCILIIFIIFNILVGKNIEKVSARILKEKDNLLTDIKQNINNIESVKTLTIEDCLKKQFFETTAHVCNFNIQKSKRYAMIDSVNNTIIVVAMMVIYCLGFYLITRNYLTVGSVIAFDIYFQMMISPIQQLIDANIKFREIKPTFERLTDFFDIKSEKPNKIIFKQKEKQICFKNVSFKYENANGLVIDNVSFCLKGNGIYGITGESGAGKSTLARLILDLYKPTNGNIRIELETDITPEKSTAVREDVSYASQTMQLFNKTIFQNLRLNESTVLDEEVITICKRLNLHNKIESLPKKYNTIITENINFSGGEIQRLILARTYLKHAEINILDEITSALDKDNMLLVQSVIEEMAKTSLVLLITHDKGILRNAKSILQIKDGNFCIKDINM